MISSVTEQTGVHDFASRVRRWPAELEQEHPRGELNFMISVFVNLQRRLGKFILSLTSRSWACSFALESYSKLTVITWKAKAEADE